MYKTLFDNNNISISDSKIPKTFLPQPDESDYNTGFIERYFIQKANDRNSFVFEIDSSTANSLQNNAYWKVVSIKWRIIGPIDKIINENNMVRDNGVYNDNISEINKAKKHIPNIKSYILNPLQFYKGRSL